MACNACGCACGEAPEEVGAPPLLGSETGTAPPPWTDISISWEAVRSQFVYASPEEERARLTRCMFRGLSVSLWLFVVDVMRRYALHDELGVYATYFIAVILAMFICTIWMEPPMY